MYCLVYFKSWKKPPALTRANINLVLHLMSEQFRRAASTPCNGTFLMLKFCHFFFDGRLHNLIGRKTKVMTVQVADGTSETLVSNRRPMYPPIYLSIYLSIWYVYVYVYLSIYLYDMCIYICVLSNLILSYSILSYTIFTDPILSYILNDLNLINSYLLYLCIYVSMYLCIYVSA